MNDTIRLKILLPTHVAIDQIVRKVSAEGWHGSFTLLPRHVDCVMPLRSGILSFETDGESGGHEKYVAVDGGTLVKCGEEVLVSAPDAVAGENLEQLELAISTTFHDRDEQEEKAHRALERMEADFIRRFVEAEHYGHA